MLVLFESILSLAYLYAVFLAVNPLEVFEEGLEVLKTVMTVMGGVAVIWGGFQIFEGYQSDNAGSKASGTKWLVGGGGIVIFAQTLIPLMGGQLTI